MDITLQFVQDVRRLGKAGQDVGQLALSLNRTESEIVAALSMLGLPMPGELAERTRYPRDTARVAMRDKLPKRMQDRLARIAKGE